MWPSLLEKAFAKMHGSWDALDGGLSYIAVVDMTGGVSRAEKCSVGSGTPRGSKAIGREREGLGCESDAELIDHLLGCDVYMERSVPDSFPQS